MERRLLLRLIAAGFLAPSAPDGLVSIAPAQRPDDAYAPAFFTPDEKRALDAFTEILIPADEHSGGAREARVARFIDVMISEADAGTRGAWRNIVAAIDREARRSFGRAFADSSDAEQAALVAKSGAREQAPQTELERAFVHLKRITIDGYYTSRIGIHEELEYQGNTALAEFPGCTHPEHQA